MQSTTKIAKAKLKTKKALSLFVYIISIPVLLYNLIILSQIVINPNENPSLFGIKQYVIVSESMKPVLSINDIVIVKKIDTNELKVGDIISFKDGNSIVTHRINEVVIDNNEKSFITKGDNNNTVDSDIISTNLIEGKVISIIPKLGKISLILQNKLVLVILIIICVIWVLKDLFKTKKRK